MLNTSGNCPSWILLPPLPDHDTPIVDIQIVVDDSGELLCTVYACSKMWVFNLRTASTEFRWVQDLGLVPFANTLKSFTLDGSLGKSTNNSTWGYLIACATGLISCPGGTFSPIGQIGKYPLTVRITIMFSQG